jgi:hypothetical protein
MSVPQHSSERSHPNTRFAWRIQPEQQKQPRQQKPHPKLKYRKGHTLTNENEHGRHNQRAPTEQ